MTRFRELAGASLRRRRKAQGRTLREVADQAGVSLTYLSEVERGRKEPSSEVLEAVCEALGVLLSDVLFEVAHTLVRLEAARSGVRVGFIPAPGTAPALPGGVRAPETVPAGVAEALGDAMGEALGEALGEPVEPEPVPAEAVAEPAGAGDRASAAAGTGSSAVVDFTAFAAARRSA
jgi:DNA-binding XRE family transcriptional regulator